MKNPKTLTHGQLAEIVRILQELLYWNPKTGQFDCDREWDAGDICQEIAALLEENDLIPTLPDNGRVS